MPEGDPAPLAAGPHAEGATTFSTPAEAYDRHVGRYGEGLAHALIRVAGVRRPQRALDVGCGPGILTGVLASELGAANVCAIDPSEVFVQACRARLPRVDVQLGRAESLPFEDAEFDVALAQLVVNFMSNPEAGVGEMRRVVRPGGVVGACVWDYAGEMVMLRAFWDAAVALDPARAGPLDEGRIMRYCTPDELRNLWEAVGFRQVDTGQLVVEAAYSDFGDFWWPFPTGVAPSGAYCASLDPDTREALRRECRRRLGSPEGPFRLTARAWYVIGT